MGKNTKCFTVMPGGRGRQMSRKRTHKAETSQTKKKLPLHGCLVRAEGVEVTVMVYNLRVSIKQENDKLGG